MLNRWIALGALAGSILAFALGTNWQQNKKPSAADFEKPLSKWWDLPEVEREATLAKLAQCDAPNAAAAKAFAKKIVGFAMKGAKLPDDKRNYFYDAKKKSGLYLLGGKNPGNGSLFFGLHGGGVGAGDAESAAAPWSGAVANAGWTAIFPEVLEKTEAAWGDEATEKFVLELLEAMKRTNKIDTNKIYLGGHSMGGYGTWTIGARNADLFAGLMAFAGAPTPFRNVNDKKTVEGIQDGVIPNLRNVPIYVYHSRDDPQVDFETNDFAVKELKKAQAKHGGYVHFFDPVDGKGHAFPDPKPPIEFISKYTRDPRPKKVIWQPHWKWKRMFYWLWWDDPRPEAIVVAEVTAPNQIAVTVTGLKEDPKGLSVLLDERLVNLDKELVITLNGKEKFRGVVPRSLAVIARTGFERRDAEMTFTASVPL
jgi:predicted esterase